MSVSARVQPKRSSAFKFVARSRLRPKYTTDALSASSPGTRRTYGISLTYDFQVNLALALARSSHQGDLGLTAPK